MPGSLPVSHVRYLQEIELILATGAALSDSSGVHGAHHCRIVYKLSIIITGYLNHPAFAN